MATQVTTDTMLNGSLANAAGPTVRLRIPAGRVVLLAALLALLGVAGVTYGAFDLAAVYQGADTAVRATVAGGQRLANDARLFYLLVGGRKIVPAAAERVTPTVMRGMKTQLCKGTTATLKAMPRRARS